ncbi:MAG: SDR family NAD(P)-dependent oxidoreductase [Lachnospiraceae bacterium]|nr:SDR family NAD(P)-dependent oxidoreductase [Lachnospiraceae bacterium]
MEKVLITGVAGFIGANLAVRLLKAGEDIQVIGIDNLNDYYDVNLKKYRLNIINDTCKETRDRFIFVKGDISDSEEVSRLFNQYRFDYVVNLAAQAGVRYSIENPDAYIKSNIIGFYNILEGCRNSYSEGGGVKHLVFASSSSVYGANNKIPFSVGDKVDEPVSLYAATKKSDELIAHSYAKLYNIPTTGLRFFTVYGPAGRPDMAYFGFTNKLKANQNIKIFNYGNCERDFTYIDDIVEGIYKVIWKSPERKVGADGLPIAPYKIYNIGNGKPVNLLKFVDILQKELIDAAILPKDYDFEKHKELIEMQPGDVPVTYADTTLLEKDFGYKPSTTLEQGIKQFAEWYADYYRI